MKTNELRDLMRSLIRTVALKYDAEVGYRQVSRSEMFPHIVFDFVSVEHPDFFRSDYTVDVEVFTKDQMQAIEIADEIEERFRMWNTPDDNILPTIYNEGRQMVEDPDRTIRRELIRLSVHSYDK